MEAQGREKKGSKTNEVSSEMTRRRHAVEALIEDI